MARDRTVRARMAAEDVHALQELAKRRRVTASEMLRWLVAREKESSTRSDAAVRFRYLSEKIDQTLHVLVLRDEPRAIAEAFEILSRAFYHGPGVLPGDAPPDVRRWYETIAATIEPSSQDARDPDAKQLGTMLVKAARLTRDEKNAFATALLELSHYLNGYER